MGDMLQKSWKDKMMATLAAAGIAGAPISVDPPSKEEQHAAFAKPSYTVKDFSQPFGQHKLDSFLNPIMQLESSGGKKTEHKPVEQGVQAGTTAVGNYALMPRTVQNVAGMLNSKSSELRNFLGNDYKDPEVQDLQNVPEKDISKKLKANPDLQNRVARYLAQHLFNRHKGNEDKMAFGWRFGSEKPSEQITDKMLNGSGYVKQFRKLKGQPNANPQ